MQKYGLLGGVLMILIQVSTSEDPVHNESTSAIISDQSGLEKQQNLTDSDDDTARWLFGWNGHSVNQPQVFPVYPLPEQEFTQWGSSADSESYSYYSRGSSEESRPWSSEESRPWSSEESRPWSSEESRPWSSEESQEKRTTKRTMTPSKRTTERSRRTKLTTRTMTRSTSSMPSTPRTRSSKRPRSTTPSTRPETSKSITTRATSTTPRTTETSTQKATTEGGESSSSSEEESEESSMETCVKHPPIWHKRDSNPSSLAIEGSRHHDRGCAKHEKRCSCPHDPYRSYDGTCNNLKHPHSGVTHSPLSRLVAARYCDGKCTPRRSTVDGHRLPSSRKVTSRLFGSKNVKHPQITQLADIFWMFVAEDIFQLKHREGEDIPKCCTPEGEMIPRKYLPKSCLPIEISKNDPFFSTVHQRCLHYERSGTLSCHDDHRPIEQVNLKTSYLDLSVVYGACEEESIKLRTHRKGQLKTKLVRHGVHTKWRRPFLPNVADARAACGAEEMDAPCYLSGNTQVNKIVTLAALQTLFVREHNKIARRLHELNPSWDDEDIFQQARIIMIGIYHHMIYNHWLGLLLGKETQRRLQIPFQQLSSCYDPNINVGAINDMVSAGLSLSNTFLPPKISLMDKKRHVIQRIDLIATIDDPSILEMGNNFDAIVRGLTAQPAQAFDHHFTKEFLELKLATKDGKVMGLDLVATDVQSGRDLGISTYNDARKLCGLQRAEKFEDFEDTLEHESIPHLAEVYACPNDLDLFAGLAMEVSYDGGVLGRIGSCLFGEQFARLRLGDRFFVNTDGFEHSLNNEQLEAILAVSFSSLVCDSSDRVSYMQPDAFSQISSGNPLKPCRDIPELDLKQWKNIELPRGHC